MSVTLEVDIQHVLVTAEVRNGLPSNDPMYLDDMEQAEYLVDRLAALGIADENDVAMDYVAGDRSLYEVSDILMSEVV